MTPSFSRGVAVQLLIIRTAMLAGLVLFGVATMFMRRNGTATIMTDDREQLFSYIFIGLASAALAGLILIRTRLENASDAKQLFTRYIVGYAMAESAALFGGITWFLGGASEWFIAGLVLMVVAFQVLPVRRDA